MKNFIFFAVIKLKFPRVGLDEKGGVFIINFEHISHRVSIVNFEHVNAGWEDARKVYTNTCVKV